MGQVSFLSNFHRLPASLVISNATMTFVPFNVLDNISFKTVNIPRVYFSSNSSVGFTFSVGLYSLTGSTLSIANSISGSQSFTSSIGNGGQAFISMSATSANQNLTPGTWYFGILVSLSASNNTRLNLFGFTLTRTNAWPGGFIGGQMTASTNALPSSIATADLNQNSAEVLILLTA